MCLLNVFFVFTHFMPLNRQAIRRRLYEKTPGILVVYAEPVNWIFLLKKKTRNNIFSERIFPKITIGWIFYLYIFDIGNFLLVHHWVTLQFRRLMNSKRQILNMAKIQGCLGVCASTFKLKHRRTLEKREPNPKLYPKWILPNAVNLFTITKLFINIFLRDWTFDAWRKLMFPCETILFKGPFWIENNCLGLSDKQLKSSPTQTFVKCMGQSSNHPEMICKYVYRSHLNILRCKLVAKTVSTPCLLHITHSLSLHLHKHKSIRDTMWFFKKALILCFEFHRKLYFSAILFS